MSRVMQTNTIEVFYALEPELVLSHWVETGEFWGDYARVVLTIDSKWKRQLIADLGWYRHDDGAPLPVLDPDGQLDSWPLRNVGWVYDGILDEKSAWKELKKLAKEMERR